MKREKIAVIDKAPSKNNYSKYFSFEFDLFHMSSVPITKLLKKDVDLVVDLYEYDLVILVGAEAAKEYAKVTSVTNYAGLLVDDKYVCISNPAMLIFKPEGKPDFERAVSKIEKYVAGTLGAAKATGDYKGICNENEAIEYFKQVLSEGSGFVTMDTETTSLYPRDGYVLGLSMTHKPKHGRYILTDVLGDEAMQLLEQIIAKFDIVFHNLKFDYKMLSYHLGLKFDRQRVHDTMIMHYILDENDAHGLKALALKYTDFGDYDAELDEFKKAYCAKHSMLQDDFTYDKIPFEIMSEYACLTHDSLVYMADGTKRSIGDLVRTNSTEAVLSYDTKTGQYTSSKINGWIKQKHPSQEWFSVVLGMGTSETVKGSENHRGPKFTADHKVYTTRGWVEVQDLTTSDRILSQEFDLSADGYQIFYGSMLGDGRFDSRYGTGAGFSVSQAEPRKNYAKFKADALGCTNLVIKADTRSIARNAMYTYKSPYSLLYTDLYSEFVMRETSEHQKPLLNDAFLSKLTLKSIAIWYMDDGNLAASTPRIWSRTTSSEERRLMLLKLKDLGLEGVEFFDDGINNSFFKWNLEHHDTFFNAIAPYVHKDCTYKVPTKYQHLVGTYNWDTVGDVSAYYAKVLKVVPWHAPAARRGYKTKWCINVENTHCFFTESGLVHNCMDTACTYELYVKFKPIIAANAKLQWLYDNLMIPGILFLMDMEEVGIPMSKERLEAANIYLEGEIISARKEIFGFEAVRNYELDSRSIFNPGSVMQLRKVLFDYAGLTPTGKMTKAGAISTDAEVLTELAHEHELPKAILRVRQLSKIHSSYITKILPELDRDGRIRTNFNLTFTTSGRLSSSGKFNAQQIPRDSYYVKGAIKAPVGYKIVSQDLSTAEVLYAAVLSGDQNLQAVFRSGGDLHSSIAKMVFNLPCAVEDVKKMYGTMRQAAKAITFGILYGSGPAKVAESVTKATGEYYSLEDARENIKDYFTKFSRLKKWLDSRKEFISANGYTYSFFGRKRRLPNVFSADKGIASHEVRSGINAEVQSLNV